MTLLDGKSLSVEIENSLTKDISALAHQGVTPGLAVILVGNNPASCAYVQTRRNLLCNTRNALYYYRK